MTIDALIGDIQSEIARKPGDCSFGLFPSELRAGSRVIIEIGRDFKSI
jgi:hypothetical protein